MPKSEKKNRTGTVAIAALVGGAAGAFVSLLIAPKSGKALRQDLQNRAEGLIEQVEDATSGHAEAIKQKGTELVDKGKKIKADLQMLLHDLKPRKLGYIDIAQSPQENLKQPATEINPPESSSEEIPPSDEDIETLP